MWPACPSLFTLIITDDGSDDDDDEQLASNCCTTYKAGRVIDGQSDGLGRLVVWWGRWALSHISDTFNPHLASLHHSYPHQLPVTPHHSPASACHVLGVKGFPTIAHQNGAPPTPAPRTKSQSIGWQTEMDWDVHDPVPFRGASALHGAAVTD